MTWPRSLQTLLYMDKPATVGQDTQEWTRENENRVQWLLKAAEVLWEDYQYKLGQDKKKPVQISSCPVQTLTLQ